MERDFKGVWIPKEIWLNKELTITEKVLLVEIDSLSKNGECFASNEHFAEFLDMHKNNVSRMITGLIEKGFLKKIITYKKGSKLVEKRVLQVISKVETRQYQNDIDQYPNDITLYQNDITQYQNVKDSSFINNTSSNTTNNTVKDLKDMSPTKQYEMEFETFWKLYPPRRNASKKKAKETYINARKGKRVTYEQAISGVEMYINYIKFNNVQEEYIKHASTWLNQECWNNDYSCGTRTVQPKRKGFVGLVADDLEKQQAGIIDFEGVTSRGKERYEKTFGYVTSALSVDLQGL